MFIKCIICIHRLANIPNDFNSSLFVRNSGGCQGGNVVISFISFLQQGTVWDPTTGSDPWIQQTERGACRFKMGK